MWKVYRFFNDTKEHIRKKDGVGVIEMILILVVLIAIVILFRDKLKGLVDTLLGNIEAEALGV